MSRVFDQYMSDKIEINGVLVSIIEPNNHDELMKAFAVKDLSPYILCRKASVYNRNR